MIRKAPEEEAERNADGLRRRARKEKEYPREWGDSFGEKYYSGQISKEELKDMSRQAERTEEMVCNLGDEGVTSAEEAARKMNQMIREITDGDE